MQQTPKGLRSIRGMLTLIMVLVCAVPLIIAVAISFVSTMTTAQENAEELNERMVSIVENSFSTLIDQNIRAIEVAAASPSTRDYLTGSAPYRASTQEGMVAFLQGVDAALGDDNSTVITGPDGIQVVRSKGNYTEVSSRDYFIEGMKGNTYVSDVIISKTTGSRIIVPVVPVYDYDGVTVMGVVTRNYDISHLHEFLAEQASEDTEIFIVDRDGVVIAHSDHEITADDDPDDRSGHEFFKQAQASDSGTFIGREDGRRDIVSYSVEPTTGWTVVMARDYDATMTAALGGALIIVIIGVVMLVVAAAIGIVYSGRLATVIRDLNDVMGRMADGDFSRIDKHTERGDELGMMVAKTNEMADKIGSIVTDIKSSAERVHGASAELAGTAGQIAQTSDDVANAVQEIATGATQQADEIQQATENTNRISENIQSVTARADDLAATADEMQRNSQESADKMRKLRTTTQQMATSVEEIAAKISATGEAVDRINKMVASINSIASQTNLLALNASIEAARAGEAGRGFAVVAEEIGNLADDSARTADEIHKEMGVLLDESQSAVKQTGEVRRATEEQREVLTSAIDSIRELVRNIDMTVEGVGTIKTAADACDASKTVVVDAMSSLSAISEENAAASEETSASMEEMSATVTTLSGTADDLRDISESLLEEMRFFK